MLLFVCLPSNRLNISQSVNVLSALRLKTNHRHFLTLCCYSKGKRWRGFSANKLNIKRISHKVINLRKRRIIDLSGFGMQILCSIASNSELRLPGKPKETCTYCPGCPDPGIYLESRFSPACPNGGRVAYGASVRVSGVGVSTCICRW